MVRQYVLWTDDFSVFVFAFVFVFVFKYSGIIVNKGKGGEGRTICPLRQS